MINISDASLVHSILFSNSYHHWYAIHCKTGREVFTAETLKANMGLIVYLPEKKMWNKGRARYIPLFPGYLFIQADLRKTTPSQINTSPGVLRFLACEGIPQEMPPCFVETLRAELTRFNECSCSPNQGFRPGDPLFVIEGPFRGLEALFIGPTTPSKRVQVLLNFLGRPTKAEVEVGALEKRINSVESKRVRYTRGKGRKIRNKDA